MQWYRFGSRESYFCLFAPFGTFPMEMSGRDRRELGQADCKCDSVSVVTLVAVAVWFCQCFRTVQ